MQKREFRTQAFQKNTVPSALAPQIANICDQSTSGVSVVFWVAIKHQKELKPKQDTCMQSFHGIFPSHIYPVKKTRVRDLCNAEAALHPLPFWSSSLGMYDPY